MVDIDNLIISQPDHGEQALEIADMLVRSGAVDVVVVDSVAALTPKAEIEGEMGDSHMGLQARLMSQALRKLTAAISKSKTCCIFTNQIRLKIGVMFGNPETQPGGRALKFYASVRVDLRRIGSIKDGDQVVIADEGGDAGEIGARGGVDHDLGLDRLPAGAVGHHDARGSAFTIAKNIRGITAIQKLHTRFEQSIIQLTFHLHRCRRDSQTFARFD